MITQEQLDNIRIGDKIKYLRMDDVVHLVTKIDEKYIYVNHTDCWLNRQSNAWSVRDYEIIPRKSKYFKSLYAKLTAS